MDDVNWNRAKDFFRTKYYFELQDEDRDIYVQYTSKYPKGPQCFMMFLILTLFFIIIGIAFGELTVDKYTFASLGVIIFLMFLTAGDINRKMDDINKQLIEEIRKRRGQAFQSTYPPMTTPINQSNILRPKPASVCPLCGKSIPYKAEICNHCGQPLIWE